MVSTVLAGRSGVGWQTFPAGGIPPGLLRYALDLNGCLHYVTIPNGAWASNVFSFSGWWFFSSEQIRRDLILFSTDQWPGINLSIAATDGRDWGLRLYPDQGGNRTADTRSGVVPADQWVHIAVSLAAPVATFWINGVQISTVYTFGPLGNTFSWSGYNLQIGAAYLPTEVALSQRRHCGYARDLQFHDHALSSGEVATLYNGGRFGGVVTSGRTGLWYSGAADHRDRQGASHGVPTPNDSTGPRFIPSAYGQSPVAGFYETPPIGGRRVMFIGDSKECRSYGRQSAFQNWMWWRHRRPITLVGSNGLAAMTVGYFAGIPQPNVLDTAHFHCAHGGDTIADMMTRAVPDIATYRPDAVFFSGGVNDAYNLGAGGVTAETIRDRSIAALNTLSGLVPTFWEPCEFTSDVTTFPDVIRALRAYTPDIAAATSAAHLVDTRPLQQDVAIAIRNGYESDTTDGTHLMRSLLSAEASMLAASFCQVFPS